MKCHTTSTRPSLRWVRLLVLVSVFLSPLWAAHADTQRILLLHHPVWRKEEAALLEALRIYTRDLNGAIVSADANTEASQSVGNRALSLVAQQGRSANARAVAWFFDDGGLRLYTLRVATMDLQITPVQPRDDLDVAAQTLALKLRAFLTQDADEVGAPPIETHSDVRALSESGVLQRARPSGFVLQTTDSERTLSSTLRPVHLEIGFAYGIDVPIDPQWLRHHLALRAALVFATRPLAIEIDGAATTRPTVDSAPYQVSIGDYPIGLALSIRLARPRFVLSAGPRVGLHIIQAELLGSGAQSGDIWRYSAGLGLVAQGRVRLLRFLSVNLAMTAEGTIPRQRFTVGGQAVADLGGFRFASALGLLFEVF